MLSSMNDAIIASFRYNPFQGLVSNEASLLYY